MNKCDIVEGQVYVRSTFGPAKRVHHISDGYVYWEYVGEGAPTGIQNTRVEDFAAWADRRQEMLLG